MPVRGQRVKRTGRGERIKRLAIELRAPREIVHVFKRRLSARRDDGFSRLHREPLHTIEAEPDRRLLLRVRLERRLDAARMTDNVGDASVEINVEDLINEIELQGIPRQLDKEVAARRRLEELMEQRRAKRELEDFEDYEI